MENAKPKEQPEGKFAEVIRKGKEKRQGMSRPSEAPTRVEQDSPIPEQPITES